MSHSEPLSTNSGHAMPRPATTSFPAGQSGAAPSTFARWRTRLHRALANVRRIVGVPDYDAYLQHMQREFPDCTPMDPRTFERERQAAKYTQPGSRCC